MEKNWAELLDFIYTHDEEWEYFDDPQSRIDESHPFVERTDLNPRAAESALSFLKRNELIEHTGSHYQLSQKGFKVAREQETKERQKLHDQGVRILTVVLALAAVAQLLSETNLPSWVVDSMAVGVAAFLVGAIYFAVPRTEVVQ